VFEKILIHKGRLALKGFCLLWYQAKLFLVKLNRYKSTTDNTGNSRQINSYDPYGNRISGDASVDFQFKGEQPSADTGLTFMRARYYDPTSGRFISKDPVEGMLDNPQSQNGYSYAHNDPVNLSDPSGEFVGPLLKACGLGASAACADGNCTNEVVTGVGVYRAVVNGAVQYVGISNDIARRAAEHASRFAIEEIPALQNLSRLEARAAEQALIEKMGINNLQNIRNSISPSNPTYEKAIELGQRLIQNIH